jgi:hypothetical protein
MEGSDVSLLEVSTLSYIVLAFFTFLFWWKKPSDVERPFNIQIKNIPRRLGEETWIWGDNSEAVALSVWSFVSACFAGIHCAAWNYSFLTLTEAVMWRTSSLLCFALPLLVGLAVGWELDRFIVGHVLGAMVLPLFYILARLFLIVEAFIAFRSSPASVYTQVLWTNY